MGIWRVLAGRRVRAQYALVALAAVAAVVVASTAAAAATGGNKDVAGCVGKGGQLRVVGKPGACKGGERAVSLARAGGAQASVGQNGKGERGPRGRRGPQGERGPKGERGPAGAAGPRGPQGTQGEQGPRGATGPQGPAGPASNGTPENEPNTDVARDADGGFAAGAVSLEGKLTQTSDAGLVSAGTFGQGAIPAEGAGTRVVWYPGKAAFRAGYVDGTQWDDANVGNYSTAMGYGTTASGTASTAMGSETTASGDYSTATGFVSTASGISSTATGQQSTASGISSTAMGAFATASGGGSTAIGNSTTASGNFSTALGNRASTRGNEGAFVYGDNSSLDIVGAGAPNQFVVRASGGTTFYSASNLSTGVSLAPGGSSWASVSDKNRKENFRPVDGKEILDGVTGLPMTSWNYKGADPSRRYVGPMSQDFRAAFGLGDEKTITTQDMDGVTLAAVQELGRRTEEAEREKEALEEENERLRTMQEETDERLEKQNEELRAVREEADERQDELGRRLAELEQKMEK